MCYTYLDDRVDRMSNVRKMLLVIILCLLVITIGISFAYYSASVHGTGNMNANSSALTATLGEVEFNGESTFDTATLDEIYPGFIGVQTFTISPYKDGRGKYEIELLASVREEFGHDIRLTIYKTSEKASNYCERMERTLTVEDNKYAKNDYLNIIGAPIKVYEGALVNTHGTVLEQVDFNIEGNAFVEPDTTPDGYYTYYAVYEYLNNGNQNSQQGLDFNAKITVKYVMNDGESAKNTLAKLQTLNANLQVNKSSVLDPLFMYSSPYIQTYSEVNTNPEYFVTYSDTISYNPLTGNYELINPVTSKYSNCYTELKGKYIVVDSNSSQIGSESDTPITSNNTYVQLAQAYSDGYYDVLLGDFKTIDTTINPNNYVTYSDTVSYDGISGKYILKNFQTCKYSECYNNLSNKFVILNEEEFGTSNRIDNYNGYFGYVSVKNADSAGNVSLSFSESLSDGLQRSGLFENVDDYGTSYYFRGDVDNNYVKFGGFYWRIIRINGDGSIRMIYAGDASTIDALPNKEEVLANGHNDSTTGYTKIGTLEFNAYNDDNTYAGYMYGTPGSSTYKGTHANIHDSKIKYKIDVWYKGDSNLVLYSRYINDSIFCNDCSIDSSNLGYGNNNTNYFGGVRFDEQKNLLYNNVTLKCTNKNDRFTVSDKTYGNGALTYPIGLITMDEANMAGVNDRYVQSNYLINNTSYWTMTPYKMEGVAKVFYVGSHNISTSETSRGHDVRPVINIKSDALVSGNGTINNPFIVPENPPDKYTIVLIDHKYLETRFITPGEPIGTLPDCSFSDEKWMSSDDVYESTIPEDNMVISCLTGTK